MKLRSPTGIALAAVSWVERQQSQDIVLGPILQATLERAQVRRGERVVDIGCGTGSSSIALAERVGPSGHVLGVDVSAPMLARAAERLPPGAPVKFVRADATTYRFESAAFDLLFFTSPPAPPKNGLYVTLVTNRLPGV
jgi:SAM-dependent methyltransferase